jgi:hypothetical protein
MRQVVYVISDLHLGGAPESAGHPGFQICPPRTQQMLTGFLDRLPGTSNDLDCQLVIAGDIVDFLAEEPFCTYQPEPRTGADERPYQDREPPSLAT